MLKALIDRLSYACIGFVLGAVLAGLLWFLYDLGFSRQLNHPSVHVGLSTWVKYIGGTFALVGFIFKSHVGQVFGRSSSEVYDYEAGNHRVPNWLAFLVLLCVAAGVWYFTRQPSPAAA
jgi:hypothetical protein